MGCWFFSWGGGGGEEEFQVTTAEAYSQTTRVPNSPVYMLYIIYFTVEVSLQMRQTIATGGPDPRCPGAATCVVRASTTRRPNSN